MAIRSENCNMWSSCIDLMRLRSLCGRLRTVDDLPPTAGHSLGMLPPTYGPPLVMSCCNQSRICMLPLKVDTLRSTSRTW